MKVSTKAEHAIHAMLYVAATPEHVCSIDEIAEQESIPREFLAKILRELVKKRLLKSFKGIYGGYRLGKLPEQISFLNIIEAMDGPLLVVSCADDRHKNKTKIKYCSAQVFWIPLQDKLKGTLNEMTLDKVKPI
jgi:Rrf2 family transcriptional regulator, iron-sulfur cluster assembly transcription factor